jgi:hypothetical protein
MNSTKLWLAVALSGIAFCFMSMAQSNREVQTFPASLATNNPEAFVLRPDGKYIRNTNTDVYWRHFVWKEMTNGWRVALYVSTNVADISLISLGSMITNPGPGYLMPPYGKFTKFELLNPNGKIMQPRPNAGTNMLKWYSHDLAYQTNQPAWASPTNGSLVVDFPETVSAEVYPHFESGSIVGDFDFYSGNKFGPMPISYFYLGDLYSITNEGDYTLTVQPVLYKFDPTKNINGINNDEILHRVDLPEVTTKVHLVPNEN